jgi:hypothetical protein
MAIYILGFMPPEPDIKDEDSEDPSTESFDIQIF